MKLEYALTLQKNISQWFKDLNIRHDAIKLLEESMGKMFSDINWTFIFLGQSPKIVEIKLNMNKGDLIKLTSFCTANKTVKKKRKKKERDNLKNGRKYMQMMNRPGLNFKYTDRTIQQQQQQKQKKPNQKMGRKRE